MQTIIGFGILLGTVAVMEGVAWVVHRYLLHGPLWWLHRSHHVPPKGFFEQNDWIVLVYAGASAFLVIWGDIHQHWSFWAGLGIAAYGVLYFLLHDVLVHQRVKWRIRPVNPYLKRLVRAHKLHHKHIHREGSEAFGFLYAAKKYAVKHQQKA